MLARLATVLALVLMSLLAGPPQPAAANTIDAPFETRFATDYASAGVGALRNVGTGSIALSGVSGTVTKAYLYWHGPTNSGNPAANAAVTLNGSPVHGTNIGLSSDNCWGFSNSQAYRADVTDLVAGNGAYTVGNMVKPGINVNGASLLVFFDDGIASNDRDVVIYNGNDSNINNSFDAPGWNVSLPGINYTSGTASLQLHVSDGQTFSDAAVVVNGTTIAGPGAVFQGTTVPGIPSQPSGHAGNGRLWDIRDFGVTSFLTPGPNTLTMKTGVLSDCLSLVVALIDLPAGAAPEQPKKDTVAPTTTATPTPATPVSGWYSSAVSVGISATDTAQAGVTPSGVATITVAVNGTGTPCDATGCSLDLTADGVHTITYFATDNAGNVEETQTLVIRIDRTAPTVYCTSSAAAIWPPNHQMVDVSTSLTATDAGSGVVSLTLISATSSEADEGLGDGDFPNDIQGFTVGTGDLAGQVRAERSGTGTGREYALTYSATDAAGNTSTCTVTIAVVPHDRRGN